MAEHQKRDKKVSSLVPSGGLVIQSVFFPYFLCIFNLNEIIDELLFDLTPASADVNKAGGPGEAVRPVQQRL